MKSINITGKIRELAVGETLDIYTEEMRPTVVRSTCSMLRDYGLQYSTERRTGLRGRKYIRVTRIA